MKTSFVVIWGSLAVLFFLRCDAEAQWVQTNGPYGGGIYCFATSGTNLFAGTEGGGVILSTNNGTSWTAVNTGSARIAVKALAVSGSNLFAGASGGIVWRRPLSEMITSVRAP